MAKLGLSTGTIAPLATISDNSKSKDKTISIHGSSKITYFYDFRYRKEDPSVVVKWLRKNFGERGHGYDFYLNFKGGTVQIEVWDDKLKFMYEIWIK